MTMNLPTLTASLELSPTASTRLAGWRTLYPMSSLQHAWHLRNVVFATAALVAFAACARAGDEPALPLDRLVGSRVGDFRFVDVQTGRETHLYGLAVRNGSPSLALGLKPARAVVFVFVAPGCPLGDKYLPRLAELAKQYDTQGVWFFGMASGAGDTRESLKTWADERVPGFPILHDAGNVQADAMLVERSNEVIVIDAKAHIRYRGAIDDQYGYDDNRPAPRHTYLKDALDAVLASPPATVAVKGTLAAGCLLTRLKPSEPKLSSPGRVRPVTAAVTAHLDETEPLPDVGNVTYAGDVAAILESHCQSCHRPGQVGGFSLLTFNDARSHVAMMAEVVANRRMPPWHADPRHGAFANDRRLTPHERATLLAWAAQAAPAGDLAQAPPQKDWPEGWTIGKPDIVFEIPEVRTVPAQGTLPYYNVTVPTNLKEDIWVQAAEARPGNPGVVHHIIVFIESPAGRGNRRLGGDKAHLCGYAPGDMPSTFPSGTAKRIPAGSTLKFQLHYTPNGMVTTDRSKLGLILATQPPDREAVTIGIANSSLVIPPGVADHAVRSRHRFLHETRLLSFMPHMHLRGKSFCYTLERPGAEPEVLLDVPGYDFGWQSSYRLAEPRILPPGSEIVCDAVFDNSDENPANPDPSIAVRWGEQTWEEMMIGYVDVDFPIEAPAAD
ncbi:MAG: redoxin domain-containing protein [Planctomycetes bacterium]|nr:redoxin domain-containing protein [Planctomycetota bacterium]